MIAALTFVAGVVVGVVLTVAAVHYLSTSRSWWP